MNDKLHPFLQELLKKYGDDTSGMIEEINHKLNKMDSELQRLNIILDTSPTTISWINSDNTYIGVNAALAKACKLHREEFVGKMVGFYTKNTYFNNFSTLLFQSPNQTLFEELETKINEKTKKYWVSGTKYDDNKKAVLIGIDITELKNMEDHISFTEKLSALGEMVAGILHEINNPLTVIEGRSTHILRYLENKDYEKIKTSAEQIKKTGKQIGEIVNGVKSFVRHGNQDPMVDADIFKIINEAYSIVKAKLKKAAVVLTVDESLKDLTVNCNVTHIFQVFVNLMTNATDAMIDLDEKWLKISGGVEGDKIIIRLTDAGTGIPQDIADHMFESFYTTKKLGKGMGLGLSLCKRIMDEHKGTIEIETDAPNTTFKITFPK